jgi:hypothetical protein
MTIRKITCIQMRGEYPDFTHRLVMPDYGLPVIGTLLSKAGYDVRMYVEDIRAPEWDVIRQSDLVCFSTLNPRRARNSDRSRGDARELLPRGIARTL